MLRKPMKYILFALFFAQGSFAFDCLHLKFDGQQRRINFYADKENPFKGKVAVFDGKMRVCSGAFTYSVEEDLLKLSFSDSCIPKNQNLYFKPAILKTLTTKSWTRIYLANEQPPFDPTQGAIKLCKPSEKEL